MLISLTKLEYVVSQTGVSGFDSSNSTVCFIYFHKHIFTPPLGDIKGLSVFNEAEPMYLKAVIKALFPKA
jgi:hypothetical protein